MNKELLKESFREYKKAAGLDYAITNPDNLGSCMSDVNYSLCEKYGVHSKGIWAKHWSKGMNASGGIESAKYAYIAHDITPEQAEIFYKVMGQYYTVLPETYTPSSCFRLFEKGSGERLVVKWEEVHTPAIDVILEELNRSDELAHDDMFYSGQRAAYVLSLQVLGREICNCKADDIIVGKTVGDGGKYTVRHKVVSWVAEEER